ncbi:MAG: hypothetical protein C5B50_16995 [Verrucomicrobia bacterium]|nr:MAG: hypothetical protein C5B50_16995 [Verrucomicrobiota bacterium]
MFAADTWAVTARYSMDGGVTWNNSSVSALPASIGDVSAAFDSFGNLFLAELTSSSTACVVALSTNGGATFRVLYTTAANVDQPTVVTGPSSTPGQGSVWITYTPFSGANAGVAAAQGAAVTGLGLVGSFGAAALTSVQGDFGDIAIGPNGQMMIAYQDENSGEGPDNIRISVDADGLGAGLLGASSIASSTQVGGFAALPAQPSRTVDSEPGLAWDRTGGAHNGRVYLMYTDRPSTSSADTDIYVRYSDNNGSTWSSRVRVNDDPAGNGKSQFLPKIALDQTTGYIAVSFYDCRNSPANNTAELWAAVSVDGGQTFLPNVKVSAGVSSALVTAIANTGFDFGDYTGLAFHGGAFYPVWADNSNSTHDNPAGANGNFDIYTARVTVVGQQVTITAQPQSQTVNQTSNVTFTVAASGAAPISYQWLFNSNNIAGATNVSLTMTNVQLTNAGSYSVLVTNPSSSVLSSNAVLTVLGAPSITVQPQSQAAVPGLTASFSAAAFGATPLKYQWLFNSNNIAGATNSSFSLSPVQLTNAGTYSVRVTNQFGAALSSNAVLTLLPAVTITAQPQNVAALAGQPFAFSVSAFGAPPLSYQWFFNNAAIAGATNTSFGLASAQYANAGSYSVLVTNLYGSALSSNALLGIVSTVAWGDNSLGQTNQLVSLSNVVAVAAGQWHNLALRNDGSIVAWGNNISGQCNIPSNLNNALAIAAGGYHSLAIDSSGNLLTWGNNDYGQTNVPSALALEPALSAIGISAGSFHSLALRRDGVVIAWGDNSFRQCNVPAGLSNVVAVAAGGNHSLALRSDGTVVCWGDNTGADGSFAGESTPPPGLDNAVAIAAGDYHSLAVRADGTMVAWGDDSQGQCDVPPGLSNVVAVAGGGAHTLALLTNGTLLAWGANWSSQCDVPPVANVISFGAGEEHSIAVLAGSVPLLKLSAPAHQGTRFTAVAQSQYQKKYAFEYKPIANTNNWTALSTNVGNSGLILFSDPGAIPSQRYYRLRQW